MNKQRYYDTIATRWHAITGRRGGAFKELILNDALLSAMPDIAGKMFIQKQQERGVLRKKGNAWLLPGAEGLELPVVPRSLEQYRAVFDANRLTFEIQEIYGNEQLYKVKPKLRELKDVPLALLVRSRKKQI